MKTAEHSNTRLGNEAQENWIKAVFQQVSSLRFGLVQIVIHNGRVVQIEKTEKFRLDPTDNH